MSDLRRLCDLPDEVDLYVGRQIRARRKAALLSQEKLAIACGVTFQQIQKYERGANRVSCSMLSRIAGRLAAPEAAFFPPRDTAGDVDAQALHDPLVAFAGAQGGRQVAEIYTRLAPDHRLAILNLARVLDPAPADAEAEAA